jgi:3-hydroxyacyl-[acyl-carrier-protein] dehydratase
MPSALSSIDEILPHRFPFLFVDRIISVEGGRHIECRYRVPENHPYMNKASEPSILPPNLIVEALGQTAAICVRFARLEEQRNPKARGYLVRIDECSFHGPAHGGDELSLHASLMASYGPLHKFQTKATVKTTDALKAALTIFVDV